MINSAKTLLLVALINSIQIVCADDADGIAFFEAKVRPILAEYCLECHSAGSKKLRGELYLDSEPGWRRGGDSGPALLPGNPDESLVIKAIRYQRENLEMPPKQKMPQSAIDILVEWVKRGAPDPRKKDSAPPPAEIDLEKGRKFWSFQPIRKPDVPEVNDKAWPRNAIDQFILAKLEEKNLRPVADANKAILRRRLHIDLTGMPPDLTRDWEFDFVSTADRLLASRHFGERWARHWLDLARYADSSGGGASKPFPDAWKYRDHIIKSFNRDVPFDLFLKRQIAGDLLPFENLSQRYENLVATGLLVLGPRNYINDDEEAFHFDGADEQLDAVGRIFLGMTIGCARCHDHKFDPIPMSDYYAMSGIFRSTATSDPIPATTNFTWNEISAPDFDPNGKKLAAYEKAYATYRVLAKKVARSKNNPKVTKKELRALEAKRNSAKERIPDKPIVLMGVADALQTGDVKRRIRGNPHLTGEIVPRGFLRVTFPNHEKMPRLPVNQSGRRELADWIASGKNPLTARVYVNRVWTQLMGRGIVATVDNFGTTGVLPTHPELLDWLASWFLENGQSTKKLIRLIVDSRVYRLGAVSASPSDKALVEADPANHLWGRRLRRTLDAEAIRDSILFISGELDIIPVRQPFPRKLKNEFDYSFAGNKRRSIYLPRFRNNLPGIFETFDVANPATVVGQRDITILSPQALFLMNNPWVKDQSKEAALRILDQEPGTVREGIRAAYRITLCREPSENELMIAADFLGDADPVAIGLDRWTAFQQNLFASIDFRFLR